MVQRPAAVVHDLDLRLVCPGADGLLLTATLTYEPSDPYAVEATFRAADESISWVLGRDLLSDGLMADSGEGDVRVWPTTDDGTRVIMLQLRSPDGQALLEADAGDVQDFLRRTYRCVPAGQEHRHLDVDATIDRILAA